MSPAGPVRLRPLREGDLLLLHRWYQSPELWDHLAGEFEPRPEAEALAYMRRWLRPTPEEVRLGIEAGGRLVGMTALCPIDPGAGVAEFHILLGEPGSRGQGIGRQATQAMLEHGFSALGLRRIELKVLETNAAARRIYDLCGFRPVGEATAVKSGHPAALIVMAARPAD